MGYLNNSEIIVDAILTKKGREKLATGEGLNITKFALGDDEIDYTLYEPAHPKGSAYYDAAIRAIPITEASPDETQVLRYKLVTLPKGTTQMPLVTAGIQSIVANQNSGPISVSPSTSPAGNSNEGYTAVLANKVAGSITGEGVTSRAGTVPVFLGDQVTTTASIAVGSTFRFIPNPSITQTIKTTLTIYGNGTGGSITIPVTINYVQPT
jgi:hypothetical protein